MPTRHGEENSGGLPWTAQVSPVCWSLELKRFSPPGFAETPSGSPAFPADSQTNSPSGGRCRFCYSTHWQLSKEFEMLYRRTKTLNNKQGKKGGICYINKSSSWILYSLSVRALSWSGCWSITGTWSRTRFDVGFYRNFSSTGTFNATDQSESRINQCSGLSDKV